MHAKKMGRFRTDEGGEYTLHAFLDYLCREGIRQETTTPYTPQSNSMSERANQTIIETAKTMMFGECGVKYFWAEALSAAVYLRNLTPTHTIPEGSSNQAVFGVGKDPDLPHFRVWAVSRTHRCPTKCGRN